MAKTETAQKNPPAASSTEVATQAGGDLALNDQYAEFAGAGFENQDSSDYAIPFIGILQALSPQVAENAALRQGMLINTVTGEIFDGAKGVAFVPATTQHLYVEWRPREKGGGFVGVHQPSDEVVAMAQKAATSYGDFKMPPHDPKESNDLIETFYVYGVAIDGDGNSMEAVLAFTSMKIKKYKGWMTKAKTIQIKLADGRRIPAPLFAHRYRLTSVQEKNPKGSFYNWNVAFDGPSAQECRLLPSDEIFQQAVSIKRMIEEGTARAANESLSPGDGKADETQGATPGKPVF